VRRVGERARARVAREAAGARMSLASLRAATWYSWLLTGFYLYSVNLQGNVVPFLQAEFALSYRAVSLHSSAIAAGIILVGLFGDRVEARLGRRRTLWLGIGGLGGGAILLCLAPAPWASLSACFLMGALGGLLPTVALAVRPAWQTLRPSHCIGLAAPRRAPGAGGSLAFAGWTSRASPGLY
jgi:MFS family permease